jgi:hypothetical protein
MVTLQKFIKNVDGLEKFARKTANELLFKRGKEIVDINNAELLKGKNVNNKFMQLGYSAGYARKRIKKGLQTKFVDLSFTGKYQKSRKAVKAEEGLNIESDADYEKYLRGNFPEHVGLNEKEAEKIAVKISEQLAIQIKKFLVS